MAIKNLHTYAEITEKKLETQYTFKSDPHYEIIIGYQVVFITEYDKVIFGYTFHKTKTDEVPFLFKTLEMAKDFCEVKPNYDFEIITNADNDEVKYNTYKLTIGENNQVLGYIWWDRNSVLISDENCHMKFDFDKQPIVYGFVKNIWLDSWEHTHSLRNVKYYGFDIMLSKLIPVKSEEPKERKWKFELVEQ